MLLAERIQEKETKSPSSFPGCDRDCGLARLSLEQGRGRTGRGGWYLLALVLYCPAPYLQTVNVSPSGENQRVSEMDEKADVNDEEMASLLECMRILDVRYRARPAPSFPESLKGQA